MSSKVLSEKRKMLSRNFSSIENFTNFTAAPLGAANKKLSKKRKVQNRNSTEILLIHYELNILEIFTILCAM